MMVRHIRTHNKAPIEVEPSAEGNILVTGDTYEILSIEDRVKAKLRGFVLRKNHFATCAHAKLFAKKPQKAVANVTRGPWR